jgi:hypothetical protein
LKGTGVVALLTLIAEGPCCYCNRPLPQNRFIANGPGVSFEPDPKLIAFAQLGRESPSPPHVP